MANAICSQAVLEALSVVEGTAYLTNQILETVSNADSKARSSQILAEVLTSSKLESATNIKVTRELIEIISQSDPALLMTGLVIETISPYEA
jgi:hypothetical protein